MVLFNFSFISFDRFLLETQCPYSIHQCIGIPLFCAAADIQTAGSPAWGHWQVTTGHVTDAVALGASARIFRPLTSTGLPLSPAPWRIRRAARRYTATRSQRPAAAPTERLAPLGVREPLGVFLFAFCAGPRRIGAALRSSIRPCLAASSALPSLPGRRCRRGRKMPCYANETAANSGSE